MWSSLDIIDIHVCVLLVAGNPIFECNLLGVCTKLEVGIEVHYVEYACQIKGGHGFSVSNVSRVVK